MCQAAQLLEPCELLLYQLYAASRCVAAASRTHVSALSIISHGEAVCGPFVPVGRMMSPCTYMDISWRPVASGAPASSGRVCMRNMLHCAVPQLSRCWYTLRSCACGCIRFCVCMRVAHSSPSPAALHQCWGGPASGLCGHGHLDGHGLVSWGPQGEDKQLVPATGGCSTGHLITRLWGQAWMICRTTWR